ncbi:ABC-type lipoprotein release transport system permease subunit [Alteromonadaceae bacterium 2753L.S.0a.02]|nr:ABC-type lipoprotein release transport system permease subunit [Alteromonadaceae bacterium 2753L.S.0a.02]
MMTTFKLLLQLAWRNLWRNWRRTLILLLAVSVGVWSLTSSSSLMKAWSASSLDSGLHNLTGQGQIHALGYRDDPGVTQRLPTPGGKLKELLNAPRVAHWAPRVSVPAVIQSEYDTYPITLTGVVPEREQGLSFIPDTISEGRYLNGTDDAGLLLGRKLAKRLHTGLGRRVVLMSQAADGSLAERGFQVVGIFSSAPDNEINLVFTGLANSQAMLGLNNDPKGQITGISFALGDINNLAGFVLDLRGAAPGLDIQPWNVLLPLVSAVNQLSDSFVVVWLAIMFTLLGFGIVNTLLMSLFERTREFGLLQALGMKPRLIFVHVTLETIMLVGLGTLLGLFSGALTIFAFHDGLNLGFLAAGAQWLGAGQILYPKLIPDEFFGSGILIWVLGVGASLWPAWRAIRKTPIDAMRRQT